MPSLTTNEHDEVVSVMQSYVDSLDLMLKMHPDSRIAQDKRHRAIAILAKLTAPDPLVQTLDNISNLSAKLKLRRL